MNLTGPALTEDDLKRLHRIVDDRMPMIASYRYALALTFDTDEEIETLSLLSQRITAEAERVSRDRDPLTDETLLALGFEEEFDPPDTLYTIELQQIGEDEYLFGVGYLREGSFRISFQISTYGQLLDDRSAVIVLSCPDLRTVGELKKACSVALRFGRLPLYVHVPEDFLDDELTDDDPPDPTLGELSGSTGKDHALYDEISF